MYFLIPFIDCLRIKEWFFNSLGFSFSLVNIFANHLKISKSSTTFEGRARDPLKLDKFDLFFFFGVGGNLFGEVQHGELT